MPVIGESLTMRAIWVRAMQLRSRGSTGMTGVRCIMDGGMLTVTLRGRTWLCCADGAVGAYALALNQAGAPWRLRDR